MGETDPEGLADHLEEEADELERHSDELGQQAEDVSQDWQRKRSDPGVPGAPPPAADEGEDQREGEGDPPTGAPTGKGDD